MISRISESLENDSSPWRTMAQAEAWLAASARSHWWNTDIEVEAVMRIKRFQSERDHLRIGVLRIQSGRVRGFSERSRQRGFGAQLGRSRSSSHRRIGVFLQLQYPYPPWAPSGRGRPLPMRWNAVYATGKRHPPKDMGIHHDNETLSTRCSGYHVIIPLVSTNRVRIASSEWLRLLIWC